MRRDTAGAAIVLSAGTARGAGTRQALVAALRSLAEEEAPVVAFVPRPALAELEVAVAGADHLHLWPTGRVAGIARDLLARRSVPTWIGFCDRLPLFGRPARQILVVQNPHLYGSRTPGAGWPTRVRRLTLGRWARRSARRADLVVASSGASGREVVAATGIDPGRLVVRPIPPQDVGERKGTHRDRIEVVLTVGDLYTYKQFDRAVAGVAAFAEQAGRRVTLHHIGTRRDAAANRAFDAAVAAAPALTVTSEGARPHGEVMAAMRDADVLVFPSGRETYGLPLAEALAVGLPVVCTDIGPFRDLAGDAAAYVPADAPPAAIAGQLRALDAPAARTAQARAGAARAVAADRWKLLEEGEPACG